MNLHFVSDNFQKNLEEFDKIKVYIEGVISSNCKKVNLMKNWKNDIRKTIMAVRNDFVEWIDTFT